MWCQLCGETVGEGLQTCPRCGATVRPREATTHSREVRRRPEPIDVADDYRITDDDIVELEPEVVESEVEVLETVQTSPPVLIWYRVYIVFLSVLYFLVFVAGIALLFVDPDLLEADRMELLPVAILMMFLGLPLCCVFALPLLLPRRPWVWIYNLVLIGIGCTSACTLPACVALMYFWVKPETQRYFGREVK